MSNYDYACRSNRTEKGMPKFLRIAKTLAKAHEFDPSLEYQLCAVIVKGGKILSIGFNSRNFNSLSERYKDKNSNHCCTTHSEIDAVLNKRKKIDFNGSKIFVVRMKAYDGVGLARPCSLCREVLKAYGIKKAIYTIENDEFGTLIF